MSKEFDLSAIVKHYAVCALWSSVDDNGEPLDDLYSLGDIRGSAWRQMEEDCAAFVRECADLLEQAGLSDEQIGHDFWLTRNRHGAGFWDRDLGEVGKKLTDKAHAFGEVDLYVSEDGMVQA